MCFLAVKQPHIFIFIKDLPIIVSRTNFIKVRLSCIFACVSSKPAWFCKSFDTLDKISPFNMIQPNVSLDVFVISLIFLKTLFNSFMIQKLKPLTNICFLCE